MDSAKAAEKFGISRRRVEALCADGRIPGAKKVRGKWRIPSSARKPIDERTVIVVPDDQLSLFDAVKKDKKTTLSRAEVCRVLSVSPTTLKNWIRLGKIKSDPDGLTFDKKYISAVARAMKKGSGGPLTSRRNKKKKTGKSVAADYVKSKGNKEAVKELGAALPHLSRDEFKAVLAGCAVRLYLLSRGLGTEDYSLQSAIEADGEFGSLVYDLIGKNELSDRQRGPFLKALSSGIEFVPWEDTLGFVYLSLSDLSDRKGTGIYFTPGDVVDHVLDLLALTGGLDGSSATDPCCGTGNFLLALAKRGFPAESLYGTDIDEISVSVARINLYLNDPSLKADSLRKTVVRGDSLSNRKNGNYSLVVGNPPWGYEFGERQLSSLSKKYVSADKKGAESYDLFVERGLDLLAEGGRLAYVIPEAFLNVSSHEEARREAGKRASVSFVSFVGNVFSDVQCPAVLLGLEKRAGGEVTGCVVERDGKRFTVGKGRPPFTDGSVFNANDAEWSALERISNVPGARYLKDHAKFALGIVTGNNKKFLKEGRADGYEPVLRGTDVFRFRTAEPGASIKFEPDKFQQCAPEELFRASEKLVYRFICDTPVFAYDEEGTLSLNSCNVLIPRIKGMGIKFVLAVLNSSAAAFFLDKKYMSVKLLRSHIESVPIPRADEEEEKRIEALTDDLIAGAGENVYEKLDLLISKLYGLTEEEIRTVKASVAGKNSFIL